MGVATLGTGHISACFHCSGITELARDKLNRRARGVICGDTLEILETNYTKLLAQHLRYLHPKSATHTSMGTRGNFWETRGRVGKKWRLENKRSNISETRKDRGKVTMEGLYELTNVLSNGTIPDPHGIPFPKIGVRNSQFSGPLLSQERVKLRSSNFVRIHRVNRNRSPRKILGKIAMGVVKESRNFSVHP